MAFQLIVFFISHTFDALPFNLTHKYDIYVIIMTYNRKYFSPYSYVFI